MTIAFNALNDILLGHAAIFICIGFGFICLKMISPRQAGPGYWSFGFFANSLGFIFWAGVFDIPPVFYYLIGEVLHISGFFLLLYGAIRYSRINVNWKWVVFPLAAWLVLWSVSILAIQEHVAFAGIALKLLRAVIYFTGGMLLLINKGKNESIGMYIAGSSLILWAAFVVLSAFINMNRNLFYGFLVGFQVLAAFGMVAMIIDKMRIMAENAERHVRQLEGILPICSYCKKIRDENNVWYRLEEYIEDRSKAEFSHGICPDCFNKHRPDT